jgi:hypothetical protein
MYFESGLRVTRVLTLQFRVSVWILQWGVKTLIVSAEKMQQKQSDGRAGSGNAQGMQRHWRNQRINPREVLLAEICITGLLFVSNVGRTMEKTQFYFVISVTKAITCIAFAPLLSKCLPGSGFVTIVPTRIK